MKFTPKDPAEKFWLTFNFGPLTLYPTSPVAKVVRVGGTADANPDAMLIGDPVVMGSQVQVHIQGGVAGAIYEVHVQADSPEGERYKLVGTLPMRGTAVAMPPAPAPGNGGGGVSLGNWTPAQLFALDQAGAWFDPSDMATLFQDREGTVPVTGPGQKVGKMLDKSGNGHHWTAIEPPAMLNSATVETRATFTTDNSGKYWLEFDGTPDGYVSAPMNLSASTWNWVVALRRHEGRPLALLNEDWGSDHYAGYIDSDDGLATDLAQVPTYTIDGFQVAGNSRAALASSLTTAANHIAELAQLNVNWSTFGFGGAWYTLPFQGRFYGAVLRALLTGPELAYLRLWLATKYSASTAAPAPSPMPQAPAELIDYGPEPADPATVESLAEPVVVDTGPFSPATLFSPLQPGFWYDPSDLSSMFQDTAQTIQVTGVGDPVAVIRDKSGNGLHWIRQGNDTTRPILQMDLGGKYYLQFNGSTSGLTTVNKTIPGVHLDVFIALNRDSAKDAIWFYDQAAGSYAMGWTADGVPYYPFTATAMSHISIDAVDKVFTAVTRESMHEDTPAGTPHVIEFRKAVIGAYAEWAFGAYTPATAFEGRVYGVLGRAAMTVLDRRKVQEWISGLTTPVVEMFPEPTSGIVCLAPEGRGLETGEDWANAAPFDPLMTFKRGWTYYLADGTYNFAGTGMAYTTATIGTARITIKKATVADHGPENGWSAGVMGSGQAVLKGSQTFTSGFWTIDGNISRPLWATTGFGIKIKVDLAGPCVRFGDTNGNYAQSCQILRCDLEGNGGDGAGPFPNQDGLAWYNGSHRCLVSRCYIHDMGRCHFFCGSYNESVIIEYNNCGEFENHADEHSEMASIWPHFSGAANWTFRYNLFTHCTGTGGLMMDGDGWDIYGNVFYKPDGGTWEGGNGTIGGWSNNAFLSACRVFNNTFVNIPNPILSPWYIPLDEGPLTGNKFKNNLLVNCTDSDGVDFSWWPRHSHNHYINTITRQPDPNSSTGSSNDIFINAAAKDFRIRSEVNIPGGLPLTVRYEKDALGNTRTNWTRGAFEKV